MAEMFAAPVLTPITTPAAETVAAARLSLAHVIGRPASALPFASLGVAVNCSVSPGRIVAEDGVTATEETAGPGPTDSLWHETANTRTIETYARRVHHARVVMSASTRTTEPDR